MSVILRNNEESFCERTFVSEPVSYTHLDVYKRQKLPCSNAVNRLRYRRRTTHMLFKHLHFNKNKGINKDIVILVTGSHHFCCVFKTYYMVIPINRVCVLKS